MNNFSLDMQLYKQGKIMDKGSMTHKLIQAQTHEKPSPEKKEEESFSRLMYF